MLLLISPPLLFGWSATARGYKLANPAVKSALDKLTGVYTEVGADVAKYDELEKEANNHKGEILKLSGGVNERLNWLYLSNYLNEALPRIDGTNLVLNARNGSHPYSRYYTGSSGSPGRDAEVTWNKLKDKRGQGIALSPEELQDEENAKKKLVQINLEGVTALYAFTLTGKQAEKVADIISFSTKTTTATGGSVNVPLPGSGWVVELRGYTYHEGKEEFIRNTLLENLIDLADLDQKNWRLRKQGFLDGQMVDTSDSKFDTKRLKDVNFKKVVDFHGDVDKIIRARHANPGGVDRHASRTSSSTSTDRTTILCRDNFTTSMRCLGQEDELQWCAMGWIHPKAGATDRSRNRSRNSERPQCKAG